MATLNRQNIDGMIQVCKDIMIGKTDDVPIGFKNSKGFLAKAEIRQDVRVDGGIGNVIYNKDRIFLVECQYERFDF